MTQFTLKPIWISTMNDSEKSSKPKKDKKKAKKDKKPKVEVKQAPSALLQDRNYTSGYTFVVQQKTRKGEPEWKFVWVNYDDRLKVAEAPYHISNEITEDMYDLWKRIAIDNVFEWESTRIDPSSLRLVKIETRMVDVTPQLFPHDGDMVAQQRFAALAKLTPEEAKLLGVDDKYALHKLMSRPAIDADDESLLQRYVASNTEDDLFNLKKLLA
jgi:hypothetical protein